jgi:dTDP-4-amino-4,6-dideoxygalactose transaminase
MTSRSSGLEQILLSTPHMGDREIDFVQEAFTTNWIAPVGPHLEAFETEFCQAVGASHGAAVSTGTAALHLALILAGIQRGDKVICSTLTFAASANPIIYQGAVPIFIDSDRLSWNMDPKLLASELDRRAKVGNLPKAVVLVHLYGQSADIEPILEACRRYGVILIEDAAEALGASYKGRAPGTFGEFGFYSFNGNKIITTSGGGMLVSNDPQAIAKAKFLATQARDPAPHYEHTHIGYNYRLSNVCAGIGRGQLQVLLDRVSQRRYNFAYYYQHLHHLPGLEFMPEASYGSSTRWLTCLTIDPVQFGCDREAIRTTLAAQNIETRPVWKPMHLQPIFQDCEVVGGAVAASLFDRGLCLPSGSNLTTAQLDRVITAIEACCRSST